MKDRDLVRRLLTAAWDSEGESTARRLLLVGAGTELAAWQLESEWAPMRFPTQSLQDSPRYSDFDYSGGLFDNDIRLRSFRRVSPSVVQMHDRRYGLTFQTTYREGARLYTVKGKGSAELDTRAVLAALLSEDSSGSRRFVPPRASLGEE